MKNLFLLTIFLCANLSLSCQSVVDIPAGETIELKYTEFEYTDVQLKNKSMKPIEVSVLSNDSEKQLRSFGLAKLAKEEVMVESTSTLILKNKNDSSVAIKLSTSQSARPVTAYSNKKVNFSLRNSSSSSIPLIIPTVMNPNLSPDSMSGVTLKMGQEILFKVRGRKYVLLTVDENIQKGDILDVAKLLSERKKELGL